MAATAAGPLQRPRPRDSQAGLAKVEATSVLFFGTDANDGTWTWHTDTPSSAPSVSYAATSTDDNKAVDLDSESHDVENLYDNFQRSYTDSLDEQLNFDNNDFAPPPWMTMDGNVRDIDGTEIFVAPKSSPAAAAAMPELVSATSSLLANDALVAPGTQTRSRGLPARSSLDEWAHLGDCSTISRRRSKKRKHIGGGAIRRVSVTAKTAALATHVGKSSIHPLMQKLLEIDHPTKEILARTFRYDEVIMLSRLNGLKYNPHGQGSRKKLRKVRL